jgi:hypothetical protein
LGIKNLLGVWVKSRERAYCADQYTHRMRIMMKPIDQFFDVFVDNRVEGNIMGPIT